MTKFFILALDKVQQLNRPKVIGDLRDSPQQIWPQAELKRTHHPNAVKRSTCSIKGTAGCHLQPFAATT
jgi:hypothetical protein